MYEEKRRRIRVVLVKCKSTIGLTKSETSQRDTIVGLHLTTMRVRELLGQPRAFAQLRHTIPRAAFKPPELTKVRYPTAVLAAIEAFTYKAKSVVPSSHSVLGVVTEALLRSPPSAIVPATLVELCAQVELTLEQASQPSTMAYLANVRRTREMMDAIAREAGEEMVYDAVVSYENVEGHPDVRTATHVFEVKTSGKPVMDWKWYMGQLFAYAALDPNVETIHLVLPLQAHVWSWDVKDGWPRRNEYRDKLVECASAAPNPQEWLLSQAVLCNFPIGSHIARDKRLATTVERFTTTAVPYQLFISWNTHIAVKDTDIAACAAAVQTSRARVYVHAPYMINIANPGGNNYAIKCLSRTLDIAAAAGRHAAGGDDDLRHRTMTERPGLLGLPDIARHRHRPCGAHRDPDVGQQGIQHRGSVHGFRALRFEKIWMAHRTVCCARMTRHYHEMAYG